MTSEWRADCIWCNEKQTVCIRGDLAYWHACHACSAAGMICDSIESAIDQYVAVAAGLKPVVAKDATREPTIRKNQTVERAELAKAFSITLIEGMTGHFNVVDLKCAVRTSFDLADEFLNFAKEQEGGE